MSELAMTRMERMEDIPNSIQEMASFISRFVLPSAYQKIDELSSFFTNTILQVYPSEVLKVQ